MAQLSELSWRDRRFVEGYVWRRLDPTPWQPPRRPLSESRLALISSAGFVLPDQPPFSRLVRGGDVSFREIPAQTDPATLKLTHKSGAFQRDGVVRDANLAFPLQRVRELAEQGTIGEVNHRHLSFMGSITAPGRLTRKTAPQAAALLASDAVDVALLVPV